MGNTFEKRNRLNRPHGDALFHEEEAQDGLSNSFVMRIMQQPDAEAEADRLAEGVTSTSPAMLRREMGERLGADFSRVQFHSDPNSIQRSRAMGAQAWTRGRDVYFGRGGFDPSLAAHELVHTVQQGAIQGHTAQSVPPGTVQMKPNLDNPRFKAKRGSFTQDENEEVPGDAGSLSEVEAQAMRTFNTSRGAKVFNAIMPDLVELVKKAKQNSGGAARIKFRPKPALSFMVRAAYQDYALRDILVELVNKPIGIFKAGTRTKQYRSLIKSIGDRLGEYQAEELAMQTGMLKGQPKYEHNDEKTRQVDKRAYEFSAEDENTDQFNPGNIPEIAKIQKEIDDAGSLNEAYGIFAKFTGNRHAQVKLTPKAQEDTEEYQVNLTLSKIKLKHMARQIWDYPELRNKIGDMMLYDVKEKAKMSVSPTHGGYDQTPIKYNAYYDRDDPQGEAEREEDQRNKRENQLINGDLDHSGNHELGHVLGSSMVSPGASRKQATEENNRKTTENDILKEVLLNQNILTRRQKAGIKTFSSDGRHYLDNKGMVIPQEKVQELFQKRQADINSGKKKPEDKIEEISHVKNHYKGQIDTAGSSALTNRKITSAYGSSSATEMFAETFGDVYTHGNSAKPVSIATVKEYEKRQKKLQQMKYTYNQSNWFMKMFRRKVN